MASAAAPYARFVARWREKGIGLRNGLIASPRFQNWASASPLTRTIARRRARALFDLCAGFVYSQTLLACVRLRLFDLLKDGPRDAKSLADRMSLSLAATSRLMRAAASLKLVRVLPGGRYALADLGASMLANPSIAALVEHHALLYEDLRDPVALLRGATASRLSRFWPYAENKPGAASSPADGALAGVFEGGEAVSAYSALMTDTQALVAQDILAAYPISNHRRLLDVGGGEGAFVAAAAARAPRLALTLFDLPSVAERARGKLAALGLAERVEVVGGSFLTDSLPQGADLVSLVRIVHDHDDESALLILRAVRSALGAGGTVMVAEPMAETAGADPVCEAYFGFYLLAMGRGRARTTGEHESLLRAAGFAHIRAISTRRPMLSTVLIARAL